MISPRSWVWPVFLPITDSVFLPLHCQKKLTEKVKGPWTRGCIWRGVGFVLLSWSEEGSTLLSKLCVWLGLPTPCCVYSAVLGIVCVPACPAAVSQECWGVYHVPPPVSWPSVLPLLLLSLLLEGKRDTTVTFDSRLSQLTDWHTT